MRKLFTNRYVRQEPFNGCGSSHRVAYSVIRDLFNPKREKIKQLLVEGHKGADIQSKVNAVCAQDFL
jgi:hypothetical protein